jgi:hypothetical protein
MLSVIFPEGNMSIGTFVCASLDLLEQGKYDVALSLACSAVDATAARVFPSKNNNARYKSFLKDHMRIVTTFGTPGVSAESIIIKCANVPGIQTDSKGEAPLEDILYHIVRCGLVHECELDQRLEFTDRTEIGDFGDKFRVPSAIIIGLIAAVVLAKPNAKESAPGKHQMIVAGKPIPLNSLWGRIDEVQSEIQQQHAADGAARRR